MISLLSIVSAADVSEDTLPSSTSISGVGDDVSDDNMIRDYSDKEDVYSNGDDNSFRDLSNDISGSNVVNLTKDYIFDENSDKKYVNGINQTGRVGLIINGYNHTIDAKNNALIFNFHSSDVVLNDIIFKNSNDTALKFINSNVTLNNIVFMNELNNSRALTIAASNVSSYNNRFIDNYKMYGASILSQSSSVDIINATFTNKNDLIWSSVYFDEESCGNIINSTFTDITSKYAPAVFYHNSTGTISNSLFKNLYANLTAGAVGIKEVNTTISIVNSTFTNTTSQNNAGAVFVDIGMLPEVTTDVVMKNTVFDSCSSMIGGAYLQLGGTLIIENTTFTDNTAILEGGALFTSWTNLNITDSMFKDNTVLYEDEYYSTGGALHIDAGELYLENSTFINNVATTGEDAYLYDSEYVIKNSDFTGDIHTYFDEYSYLENNTFAKENTYNDTFYPYAYEGNSTAIDYNPIIFDMSLVNSSYFNLADYGLVPEVKDQGDMGACWAFGTVTALESAFLKATNKTLSLDISENNLQNLVLRYSPYGDKEAVEGEYYGTAATYFLSWLGVTNQETDVYDELGKISPVFDDEKKYFIYDVVYIAPRESFMDNYKYKEAILKYGAVGVEVNAGFNSTNYNELTAAAYYNSTFGTGTDHSVTLVGWNDSFDKNNFVTPPPGDGAWILQNSWSTGWGDNGYYYVSYYDTTFATEVNYTAFIIGETPNYDINYEYDIIGTPEISDNVNHHAMANKYVAVRDDLITAVGTYFKNPEEYYEITIYVDDVSVYTQNGTSKHFGYETIPLKQGIGVKENHTFMVQIRTNHIVLVSNVRQHFKENTSFIYNGKTYEDLSQIESVACIKAYAISDKSYLETDNLTTNYGDGKYLEVTCHDENGDLLADAEIQFIVNDKVFVRKTDENGKAVFDVVLRPGKYTVIVVNPVNLEKTEVILTIMPAGDKKSVYTRTTVKKVSGEAFNPTYKIFVNGKLVSQTRYITIETLNTIFNQTFINGHLTVYLDGKVIFNETVTDDIFRIILEITEKLLGQHELKVEFTYENNNTQTYIENITIR